MKISGFYGGIFSVDGYGSYFPETAEKIITVRGGSPAVRQEVFDCVISELERRKISYETAVTYNGCCGIFCESFALTDGEFSTASQKIFRQISVEDFAEISDGKTEKILAEKDRNIQRAMRFLSACKCISGDVKRLHSLYMNESKINRFTKNLWQKITPGMKGRVGRETLRSVTCLTPDGSELNMEAFDAYCEKMLVINDRVGAVSEHIIDRLRGYALGAGYDVISCKCALGNTEHLIIPELCFGVFTSKYYHRADFPNARKIYAKRFLFSSVDGVKLRTEFSLRAYRNLMNEVFASLEEIEKCNGSLDKIYSEATDISALKCAVLSSLFGT